MMDRDLIDRPGMSIVTYRNNQYETLDQRLGYVMQREEIERIGVEILLARRDEIHRNNIHNV